MQQSMMAHAACDMLPACCCPLLVSCSLSAHHAGAVLAGMQPGAISARVSRWAYGVGVWALLTPDLRAGLGAGWRKHVVKHARRKEEYVKDTFARQVNMHSCMEASRVGWLHAWLRPSLTYREVATSRPAPRQGRALACVPAFMTPLQAHQVQRDAAG